MSGKIQIYMTSWLRPDFLVKSINLIKERTNPETYLINVYDNGSDKNTKDILYGMLNRGEINTLTLDSRNTGCLYNKLVFNAMVESTDEYYCVTDNDVYPPKTDPDWLSKLIDIMDSRPDIAMLTPQLPPQGLQEPIEVSGEVVYSKFIGNTLKVVRKEAFDSILPELKQELGVFGDDGKVSELVREKGWKVAFARNVYCYHAGQCVNWGYKPEDVAKDPRKAGYGKPFEYEIENEETYIPKNPKWRI